MTSFLRFDLKTLALAAAVCLPASARADKGRSLPGPDPAERRDPAAIGRYFGDLEEPRRTSTGPIRPISMANPGHLGAERAEPSALRVLNLSFLNGTRANDASFGGEAVSNHISLRPALSGNGDFVAFTSLASNLDANDTNGMGDVFRYQISTDTTLLASPGDDDGSSGIEQFADGLGRHWQIWQNSITDDGNLVCYTSDSTHDQASSGGIIDTNGLPDVFVRDMTGGTYTRISVDDIGLEYTDGRSIDGVIAGDGSAVAFASMNSFGNANDNNLLTYEQDPVNFPGFTFPVGGFDIFYKDLSGGLVANGEQAFLGDLTLVSAEGSSADTTTQNTSIVDPGGGQATRPGETLAQRPSISADGRFVAYDSNNPRIADGVSMSVERHGVYVWDRDAALNANNTLVSINASGTANNAGGTSAVTSNVSSHTAHISPNGQFVAFTSTLDLLGGTTTTAVNQFVREVATPSTLRIANADATGARLSTGSTRGGTPTVDNNGDVTFTSFFDLDPADNNLLTDIYFKDFDSASGSTGPLLRVSLAPGGPENSKGIAGYGEGFTQGAHDRAFHDPANSRFIFSHEAPELDTNGPGTFGLRTIFIADHDATPAITAIAPASKGDPSINASIAMSDSVTSNVFTQRPYVSSNGQWLGAVMYPRNIFDGDFSFDEDFGPYPAIINLASGQVVVGTRDASGDYMNTAGFSFFDPTFEGTFGDTWFDDVYLRIRSHTIAAWSLTVNNSGGFAYVTLNDFNDGSGTNEKIIWAPTATATTRHLRSETSQPITATTFNGSYGNPLRMTPNGRYIFFNSSDAGVATEFTQSATPVEAGYRFDTMTNDIIHVSGRQAGNTQGGDAWVVDADDSGDRVLLFNLNTNLAGDIATLGQQRDHLWIRDVASANLFMIDANTAGQGSTSGDDLPFHLGGSSVDMSGDGTKVVYESNADNLVAGVTGTGGTQIYLKNVTGVFGGTLPYADTGAVVCLSISNVDGMATDPGNNEFGKDPVASADGNVYAFVSNASDLTGAGDADNNGDFFDVFYRAADTFGGQGGGTGDLLIASKNASDEQFSAPTLATVDRPNAWTNGNFAFVLMESDTANLTEDLGGSPSAAGAASSTSAYWVAAFTGGMTAADSSWELFQ